MKEEKFRDLFNSKDKRKFNFFIIDNEVFNFDIDVYAFKIYCFLAKMCNFKKISFPSLDYIVENCRISKPKVISSLKELEEEKLISISKTRSKKNKYIRNIYTLKNIKKWVNGINSVNDINSVNGINSNNINNISLNNSKKIKNNKKSKGKSNINIVREIMNYLNERTGRSRKLTDTNKRLIRSLLKEGYNKEDFFKVIDIKSSQWLGDEKMEKYLRPSTLFSKNHFDDYLNEKIEDNRKKKLRDNYKLLTNDEEYERQLNHFKNNLKEETEKYIEFYKEDKKYRKAVQNLLLYKISNSYINEVDIDFIKECKKNKLFILSNDKYIINKDLKEYYKTAIKNEKKKLKKEIYEE